MLSDPMEIKDHLEGLGAIMANLSSTDFGLRLVLSKLPGATPHPTPYGKNIYALPVGTELPVTDLTNDETFGPLVERFNSAIKAHSIGTPLIDPSLVDLRNALAHGRISGELSDPHLRLLQFSRPKNGKVRITFNVEMNQGWFEATRMQTRQAVANAMAADWEVTRRWPIVPPKPEPPKTDVTPGVAPI